MTITPNDLRNAIEVIRADLAFEGEDRLNEITISPGMGLIAYLRWEAERRKVRLIEVRLAQIAPHDLIPRFNPTAEQNKYMCAEELGIGDEETLIALCDIQAGAPEVINAFSALAALPNVRVLKVTYL